ncbi:MAG: GNAT family N-acetyltransferase [Prevotella sp.]|nr:GNAT family N-acetyltransferase [Prevotella sp.]MCM1075155.1 GNAT family N-acetyltransferase [Ruminococcus sp.]
MENIRFVRPEDATQICDIYNYYVLETDISFETEALDTPAMRRRIEDISARFPYFVYEKESKIIGFCYVHEWKGRKAYDLTLETTLYLKRGEGRGGIGTALMHALIEECRKRGYAALIACITADNIPSIKFHEKLGFFNVSHFKGVGEKFGRSLDVVDYELLL